MRHLLIFITILFTFNNVHAQKPPTPWCVAGVSSGSTYDPQYPPTNSTKLINTSGVITIPVVFHVVYNVNFPAQNISDAMINQEMTRINTDFRMLNSDVSNVPSVWTSLAADMKFEFKLACVDPQGNATTGIVRTSTTHSEFILTTNINTTQLFESMLTVTGGDDAWPTDTYLNVWVSNYSNDGGAARFPDERFTTVIVNSVTYPGTLFDGVALDYTTVGDPSPSTTFNKGRALTHEIGHWLGLWHLIGPNNSAACSSPGDEVSDTPVEGQMFEVCQTFPFYDNCTTSGNGIMFMNHMEATPDDCRIFFTAGQKDRARSFYAQNGPPATRYAFINNYFGIKHFSTNPLQVVGNQIIVNLNNPACLTVGYITTLPTGVTILSQNSQRIIFSVDCEVSGTIEVIAHASNYTDTYTFDFVNPTLCEHWPKVYYYSRFPYGLIKDNSGNFAANFLAADLSQSLNHNGPLPAFPTTLTTISFHYNRQGVTSWYQADGPTPLIALNSGDVQAQPYGSSGYGYYNVTTGSTTTGPSLVPSNEAILAETSSGGYITSSGSAIWLHTSSGSSSASISGMFQYRFNPVNNKLFVVQYLSGNIVQLNIYPISGSTISSPATYSFSSTNTRLLLVDNADKVYFLKNNVVEQYNYATNTFTTVSIASFNNTNVWNFHCSNPYTEDRCLVISQADNFMYSLNFAGLMSSSVKIATTNIPFILTIGSPPGMELYFHYAYDGNDVYIAGCTMYGSGTNVDLIIGNQTIPAWGSENHSVFFTKLSLLNDFNRPAGPEQQLVKEPPFDVFLSPNPVSTILNIELKDKNASPYYIISVVNESGNIVLNRKAYTKLSTLNLSGLLPGHYRLSVTNSKGQISSKSFIK